MRRTSPKQPSTNGRGLRLLPIAPLLLLIGVSGWGAVLAEDAVSPEQSELVGLLEAAREYEIRLAESSDALKLREPSVLNFTNPERNQERGCVFVWQHNDRPAVIGQFFRFNTPSGRVTKHAFHSLTDRPLEAQFENQTAWAPAQPGIIWKPVPDAPQPGSTRVSRLLQMRQVARRFRLHLISPKDEKTELRLAPRPLFEYTAPMAGVTDGVILSYVIATDPEAILLIEAYDEQGQTGYRYAFARFHFWRLTAEDGDRLIWEAAQDLSLSGNTFGNPETIKKIYNSFHP